MPSLRRSIQSVVEICYAEFNAMVRAEPDAGAFFGDQIEFTADHRNRGDLLIQMWYQHKAVWSRSLGLKEAVDDPHSMSDDAFKETISRAMRDHLNVVSQMHFAKLEVHFPGSIKDIELSYNIERAMRIVRVRFKNGHVAECDEPQMKSEEFMAKCMMLYDLPALHGLP